MKDLVDPSGEHEAGETEDHPPDRHSEGARVEIAPLKMSDDRSGSEQRHERSQETSEGLIHKRRPQLPMPKEAHGGRDATAGARDTDPLHRSARSEPQLFMGLEATDIGLHQHTQDGHAHQSRDGYGEEKEVLATPVITVSTSQH